MFLLFIAALLIHEMGHYLAALVIGVRVERFFLFFDANRVAIWQWRLSGTVFGIGWLPLGSYTKLTGIGQAHTPVEPWDIRAKKPWQQCIIYAAGIIANLVAVVCSTWLSIGSLDWSERFALINLGVLVINMLPFAGSDGRHLLRTMTGC